MIIQCGLMGYTMQALSVCVCESMDDIVRPPVRSDKSAWQQTRLYPAVLTSAYNNKEEWVNRTTAGCPWMEGQRRPRLACAYARGVCVW